MRNGKSALCNEQLQLGVSVGVARHSIVGATVYGATLRAHAKKPVKRTEEKSLIVPVHCQETKKERGQNKGL